MASVSALPIDGAWGAGRSQGRLSLQQETERCPLAHAAVTVHSGHENSLGTEPRVQLLVIPRA
jgi:hypothetical protein